MSEKSQSSLSKFFGVAVRGQTYLNLVYLFLAFPLGLFYFILLVTGFSLGFGLLIFWVGVFILAGMFVAGRACAAFESRLAISLLHEDMPPITHSAPAGMTTWNKIKSHLADTLTWKRLVYLLVKFPMGVFTFVVLVTLITLTLGLLAAPVVFPLCSKEIIYCGIKDVYTIDTLWKAFGCFFMGVVLFFPTLHIFNGLAKISGQIATSMLA
jgi:hypothetical protein